MTSIKAGLVLNNVSYIPETSNDDRNLLKKQAENIALFIAQSHCFLRFNSYIRNTYLISMMLETEPYNSGTSIRRRVKGLAKFVR